MLQIILLNFLKLLWGEFEDEQHTLQINNK
jgi:hypothetical protein